MGRRPKYALAGLARAADAQIHRAEVLGKSPDHRMKEKRTLAPNWTPDEDWRRDFASVTQTLQHAGTAMQRALESNKKDKDGLSEEQLEAQLREEIIKAAQTLDDEEWALMCAARAKAGK